MSVHKEATVILKRDYKAPWEIIKYSISFLLLKNMHYENPKL